MFAYISGTFLILVGLAILNQALRLPAGQHIDFPLAFFGMLCVGAGVYVMVTEDQHNQRR